MWSKSLKLSRESQKLALSIFPLLAGMLLWWLAPMSPLVAGRAQCRDLSHGLQLCALSEMAKLHSKQSPNFEHSNYAIRDSGLTLHAARNEVLANQWLIKGKDLSGLRLNITDFHRDGAPAVPQPQVSQFLAHYHWLDRGAYSWGPDSNVLAWRKFYPDALVPQQHRCSGRQLYQSSTQASVRDGSVLFWQDTFVPASLEPGLYQAQVQLFKAEQLLSQIAINLQVWPVTLPEDNSIDAVGELYRTYRMEGVGENPDSEQWRAMSNCYQQLAHAHRSTFLERNPVMPSTDQQWQTYEKHYGAMLDGSLFSANKHYQGPGKNTPVSVWRTPWPQPYDMQLQGPLSKVELSQYQTMAHLWQQKVIKNNWQSTRWFAYVFDEVDGPEHSDKNYLAMAHQQMALVQQSIDAGADAQPIDLLWTSHSNPADWREDPDLDLRGKVRLWAPNAHAADPQFLAEQKAGGDRSWFYHSGHPAVGVHSVNASGIELRTWGVIAARYDIDGVLMWAVNLGNDDKPFADPSYKPDDDRFGNGVLVYPGNQLPKIGYAAAPGAIPSIRLKSWRRGLQDYELIQLAKQHQPEATAALLHRWMPRALAEGRDKPAWSHDPADWIEFKQALLALAAAEVEPQVTPKATH